MKEVVDKGEKSMEFKKNDKESVVTEVEPATETKQDSNNETTSKGGCSKLLAKWIAFIIVGFIVFGPNIFSDSDTQENKESMDEHYFSAAEQLVSENLKSPSTALYSEEEIVEEDDYGRVLVRLAVDAENGFGATIRNYAAVVILDYDEDEETFRYNPYSAVQLYDSKSSQENVEDVVKSMNDWNEPFSDDEEDV